MPASMLARAFLHRIRATGLLLWAGWWHCVCFAGLLQPEKIFLGMASDLCQAAK